MFLYSLGIFKPNFGFEIISPKACGKTKRKPFKHKSKVYPGSKLNLNV